MSTPDGLHTLPEFEPSFTGGRQEIAFLKAALEDFWEDQLITDVVFRVKGGKEANVYACRAHPVRLLGLALLLSGAFTVWLPFLAGPVAEAFIPRNYVIDREGKIVFQSQGFEQDEFNEMVEVMEGFCGSLTSSNTSLPTPLAMTWLPQISI